jgi:hypothetical protein
LLCFDFYAIIYVIYSLLFRFFLNIDTLPEIGDYNIKKLLTTSLIEVFFNGHYSQNDSPTERIITLRITSERITSERISTERITSERIMSERINLNV